MAGTVLALPRAVERRNPRMPLTFPAVKFLPRAVEAFLPRDSLTAVFIKTAANLYLTAVLC